MHRKTVKYKDSLSSSTTIPFLHKKNRKKVKYFTKTFDTKNGVKRRVTGKNSITSLSECVSDRGIDCASE